MEYVIEKQNWKYGGTKEKMYGGIVGEKNFALFFDVFFFC